MCCLLFLRVGGRKAKDIYFPQNRRLVLRGKRWVGCLTDVGRVFMFSMHVKI